MASDRVRLVCVSDTHNDDLTGKVPDGDIFLHAGDMTDNGTWDEMEKALNWIRKLPHKLKLIIPGNHDFGLDPSHENFNPKILELYTSPSVVDDGVIYLDSREPRLFYDSLISVYANPSQPIYRKKSYAFTYLPHPNPEATAAWDSAPKTSHLPIDIWLMHGPPLGRLDWIPLPGLKGCEIQRQKITAAKPLICVFGHYHPSHGVERVAWRDDAGGAGGDGVAKVTKMTGNTVDGVYDFTDLKPGEESVFVNAAWMTSWGKWSRKRNRPVVIDLKIQV